MESLKFFDIHTHVFPEKLAPAACRNLGAFYEFTVAGEVVFTGTSTHCFLDLQGKPVFTEKVYPDFYADLKKCLEA